MRFGLGDLGLRGFRVEDGFKAEGTLNRKTSTLNPTWMASGISSSSTSSSSMSAASSRAPEFCPGCSWTKVHRACATLKKMLEAALRTHVQKRPGFEVSVFGGGLGLRSMRAFHTEATSSVVDPTPTVDFEPMLL